MVNSFDMENDFINEITRLENGALGELQKRAYEEDLPIIPPETANLLRVLLSLHKPTRILEIGCAVGFSSSLMAGFLPENGHITTIDRYEFMIEQARENFKKLGVSDRITLLEGDAGEILPMLKPDGHFDMVFLDAAKAQYLNFLPDCLRLLKVGGLLVCDDVIRGVNAERLEVPRRQRTEHTRLREFLKILTSTDGLETALLPIDGGVSVTIKTNFSVLFPTKNK